MLCWRDLTQKCAEEDCPMWMTRFDLSDVVEPEELGLNENKCALVFNEKLGVMKTMVEIIDSMDFLPSLVPGNPGTGKEKRTRGAAVPKAPAARHGTQGRKSQKSPSVAEKQMPLGK
jgi:hypothetical protein